MALKNIFSKFWNNFRLKYNSITKSSSFFIDVNNAFYDRMAGHHKIIHWRDGHPVYGAFFLPGYSKIKANHQAGRTIASMQNRIIPYMVDFALTDKCNFNCEYCSFKSMEDKKRKEMSTNEIKDVLFQCQELGVSMINFVGGEPLMRKDLFEIIRSIDKTKSGTLMFTNGWFLEDCAFELKKAGLDSICVSLDSHLPEKHDSIKKIKGAFQKAVKGIVQAKKAGLTVSISCAINEDSLKDGSFIKLIEFSKKLGVHEVIVWDLAPTGGYADRKDLVENFNLVKELINIAKFYNKKEDYPAIFPYAYNRSPPSVGCSGGTNYFYINPYGDVCPCDFNPLILGNVLKKPLNLIWDGITRNQEFSRTSWTGCKIRDKEYRKRTGMEFKKGAKCKNLK